MSSPVVADSCSFDSSRSPLHSGPASPRRTRPRTSIGSDYRRYELGVLLVTQLGYIPIAATMLSTSFYEPTPEFCSRQNESVSFRSQFDDSSEFHSLLIDRDESCRGSSVVASMATVLMAGALFGAFLAGWLADTHGRKPVVRGCLAAVCVGNLVFCLAAPQSWFITALILLALGVACGGYMVTNLVLLIECLEYSGSRLLAVSLNGWSVSIALSALIARCTLHWLAFHLVVAISALLSTVACHLFTMESCRWLAGINRLADARSVALHIARTNGQKVPADSLWSWWEILGFSVPNRYQNEDMARTKEVEEVEERRYGYSDLFSVASVYKPLFALCYCFVASSIVSFGFYFTVDTLPGDRYTNMAMMGLSKFVMGLIPFVVSSCIGRRPIVLISVGVACIASWTLCISQWMSFSDSHWSLSLLSLIIASSIDPTWKINHLYSAELFPTVVRNMARGICNVGARLGSVAAPAIVHLRHIHYLIPYVIFSVLLSVQWVVAAGFLPETKDRPLPDEFPFASNNSSAATPDELSLSARVSADELQLELGQLKRDDILA